MAPLANPEDLGSTQKTWSHDLLKYVLSRVDGPSSKMIFVNMGTS